eukprot:tig00000802_g4295.t1
MSNPIVWYRHLKNAKLTKADVGLDGVEDWKLWLGAATAAGVTIGAAYGSFAALRGLFRLLSRRGTVVGEVTELHCYPIKSCAGLPMREAVLGPRGFLNDRLYMWVDHAGSFITARTFPALTLVGVIVFPRPGGGEEIELSVPSLSEQGGPKTIRVPVVERGPTTSVRVWKDLCEAVDQGDAAARWIQSFLKVPGLRLVRMAEGHVRPVDKERKHLAAPPGAIYQTGFSDAYPVLLAAEESLASLNARLPKPVPMNRFRPNIVVRGSRAFAEDRWRRIRIGGTEFQVSKPCDRCKMTTVDQERGVFDGEQPLKELAAFRKLDPSTPDKVYFAMNLVHERAGGRIRVGDKVVLLE